MKRFALPIALLLVCFPAVVHADEGSIPIYQANTTISSPGSYHLTRDITATSGDAITINSSGVNLDLNGHTVTVTGFSAAVSIPSDLTGTVSVSNGRLVGGGSGYGVTNVFGSTSGRLSVSVSSL